MTQDQLVSISEASQILGVSEVALRYWTDEGKIKAFITPGGHRRYSRADLKKFLSSSQKVVGIKDLIMELEYTAQLHREIVMTSIHTAPWFNGLNHQSRQRLAGLSRDLLSLITRYLSETSKRVELVQQAREVGSSFGSSLAELGLPLTNSVEAFILHRKPIIEATTQLMKKREAFNGRVVKAIPLVDQIIDEALAALVSAHQAHQARPQTDIKGETQP